MFTACQPCSLPIKCISTAFNCLSNAFRLPLTAFHCCRPVGKKQTGSVGRRELRNLLVSSQDATGLAGARGRRKVLQNTKGAAKHTHKDPRSSHGRVRKSPQDRRGARGRARGSIWGPGARVYSMLLALRAESTTAMQPVRFGEDIEVPAQAGSADMGQQSARLWCQRAQHLMSRIKVWDQHGGSTW